MTNEETESDELYYVTSFPVTDVSEADVTALNAAVRHRFENLALVRVTEDNAIHFAFDPDKTTHFAKPLSRELELFIAGFISGRRSAAPQRPWR